MNPQSSVRRIFPFVEPLESRIAPATLFVINSNDSGAGSLRQALATADSTPHTAPDTIVFHLPTTGMGVPTTIILASQLTSRGNVHIIGPGAGNFIISGAGAAGVFNFYNYTPNRDSPVTISGLSITGGKQSGSLGGGGIFSTDSLTLQKVVISGNVADTGGGIYVDGGTTTTKVTILNSIITGNSATSAAGGLDLSNVSSIKIAGSLIAHNSATGHFGGLLAYAIDPGAAITISHTQIIDNEAGQAAGAWIENRATGPSKITISGSVISGNVAQSSDGGGLYITNGHTTISRCTIDNNSAVSNGAGIEADSFTSLVITHSNVSGNTTTLTGATYRVAAGISLTGVYGQPAPVRIIASTITKNVSADGAGGIMVNAGVTLSVSNSSIRDNSGAGCGGIEAFTFNVGSFNLSIAKSDISGNTSAGRGGGIFAYGNGSLKITSSRISGNASTGPGGGISADDSGLVKVTSSRITGNTSAGTGGGIAAYTSGPVKISASQITGNSAAASGGGAYFALSPVTIKNTLVSGNNADDSGGGFVFNQSAFSIISDRIVGNISQQDGGAILSNANAGTITDSVVTGNFATGTGGGVENSGGSYITLQRGEVTGNIASVGADLAGGSFNYGP
jgi:fibronectin-binding autotransporter adhesin